MKARKTVRQRMNTGIKLAKILACIAGAMISPESGCGNGVSNFSTPEAKVYRTEGLRNSQYSCVDFKDFGSEDDAYLGVTSDDKGGFDLCVGVNHKFTKTEIGTNNYGKVFHIFGDSRVWKTTLKKFEGHSKDKESLEADVKNLLKEAAGYIRSPQYREDLAKALEPEIRRENDFTLKTVYSLAR